MASHRPVRYPAGMDPSCWSARIAAFIRKPFVGGGLLDQLRLDIAYAGRTLIRSPSFAVAVLSLALGVGATTAIYSNVDWLLHRSPRAVREPDRLVSISQSYRRRPDMGAFGLSRTQVDTLAELQDGFSELAAYSKFAGIVSTDAGAEQVVLEFVQGRYASVLGLRPALGRLITPEDDVEGAPVVAVLAHAFWTSQLGADPAVLERSIRINGVDVRVIGVMPADFEGYDMDFNGPTSVFVPVEAGPALGTRGFLRATTLRVIGRLRPGLSFEAVARRTDAWHRMLPLPPTANQVYGPTFLVVEPSGDARIASDVDAREFLGGLLLVCGLVMLAASCNVANVFLGRTLVRTRELAMRAAIGASRGRLAQQMVVEGVVVAGVAGALAVAFGALVARLIAPLPMTYLDVLFLVSPITTAGAADARMVGMTLGLAVLSVSAFGLLPALTGVLRPPAAAMRNPEAQWSWSGVRVTPRQVVLVLQVAISVCIAVVAGLYARSFAKVASVEPQYTDAASVLVTRILPRPGIPPAEGEAFHRRLWSRIEAMPEVVSASIGWNPPYKGGRTIVRVPGDETREVTTGVTAVAPRFFETLGIPTIAGREFVDPEEDANVLLINQTLATILWPNEDPIGRVVIYGSGTGTARRVVGVVADEHCNELLGEPAPCAWQPFPPGTSGFARIRTRGEPMALVPALRAAVRELDRDAAVAMPSTLQAHVDRLTGSQRTAAAASMALAGFALVLVGLGCVSLFLSMVNASLREIAIRMALGAAGSRLTARIVLRGMVLTATGVALGLALASIVTRRLPVELYHVAAGDPLVYVAMPLLVFAVGLTSVGHTARVATRTEPGKHLQAQ
jgi:putative ABC transport system permease protein